MTERYIEMTCDVCGEVEWSAANEPMREFKAGLLAEWKFKRNLAMCSVCVHRGHTWAEATLHTSQISS